MRRFLTAFVIILCVVLTVAAQESPLWFDSWTADSAPTPDEAQAVADAAAAAVFGAPLMTNGLTANVPRFVIITVGDGRSPARTGFGSGIGYPAAIEAALSLVPVINRPAARVRIEIVTEVLPERLRGPEFALGLDPAQWGLAFATSNLGVVRADDLRMRSLLMSSKDLDRDAWIAFAGARGDDVAGLEQMFGRSPLDVYRFTTVAFESAGGLAEPVALVTLDRLYADDLTPELLLDAAALGGAYLTHAVDREGSFAYSYDSGSDLVGESYNILRHAGTTFSMLELYRITSDSDLLSAAGRALDYLVQQTEPCAAPVSGEDARCLVEDNEVKLGGAGLALLAFSEHAQATGDLRYLDTMRSLAAWIAGAQYPDGRFAHIVQNGEITDFESLYYPGEAIFGLMRLYAIDPDPRWLARARAGADYIMLVRDIDTPDADLEHDHWFLYGLDALHRVDPQPHDLMHLRRLVAEIVSTQHRSGVPEAWLGGYYSPPRSTPTATRSEGLCAASRLLSDLGEDELAESAFEAVLWGVAFQLQTQLTEADSLRVAADPAQAIGGFRESLSSGEVRIDYVQHNISAILCAREGLLP